MSLPSAKIIDDGALRGTIYDFADVGDELPEHVHDEATKHYTFVTRGRVEAFGPGWSKVLVPGDVVRFPAGKEHGFRAVESNSRVIQITY